jgi:DNA primase
MQVSEEIKARLDIVDVIREYVPNLKAAGMNFSALSPFKREKTPSFFVSPDKQIWHCFSTGKGGDVISFVMEMEGLTFVEALRVLAPKAGVTLKRESPEMTSKRNRLLDIMETAALFYHKTLLESPLAAAAREYVFNKRGLSEKTVMDWQIGYSPDTWDSLMNHLKKNGFAESEIFTAGLASKKEGRNSFYDRFRGRIMFPISDVNGNIIAFTARVSPEKEATEVMGKYVNSPETPIYSKGKVVFGLHKAKMPIKEAGYAIIVEGQMDCISAHQAGFNNIVASSGTAFTPEQLKLIKRYSNNIAFCFDMDEAGQMAADRAIKEAMSAEMNIKVITLPSGKDPDELIRKDVEGWKNSVRDSKHVMKYYFTKIFSTFDIKEAEGKREAARHLLPVIGRMSDLIERDHWLKELAQELNVTEDALRETLMRFLSKEKRPIAHTAEEPVKEEARLTREDKLSEAALSLILRFPALMNYAMDKMVVEYLFGQASRLFYRNLIIYYNDVIGGQLSEAGEKWLEYGVFRDWLGQNAEARDKDEQVKLLEKLAMAAERDFGSLDLERAKNEMIITVSSLKEAYYSNLCKEKERLIADAERRGDQNETAKLFSELAELKEERRINLISEE